MTDVLAGLGPIRLQGGGELPVHIAHRRFGYGATKVLLLHALTGGPEAADSCEKKGWWGPLFLEGAPLAFNRASVWAPNLPGSCYGSVGPSDLSPFPAITPRDQAAALALWIEAEGLTFDVLLGGSLGGMVALELALLAPDRFANIGVIGCGGRSDAWIWGTHEIQRRILQSDLPDEEAIALARHAAMLSFRGPESLNHRFTEQEPLQDWLRHHGEVLSARFTRDSYIALLDAMDAHDIGRKRGGLVQALRGLKAPIHVLGLSSDTLFTPPLILELAHAADAAGHLKSLKWITSPHGHDAFLMEWDQVAAWLEDIYGKAS